MTRRSVARFFRGHAGFTLVCALCLCGARLHGQERGAAVVSLTAGGAAVELFPPVVVGGTNTLGQVSLAEPAGPGGTSLAVESSDPAVVVPPSVTVAPGETMVLFAIVTLHVAVPTDVILTLSGSAVTGATVLRVLPPSPALPGNLLVNGSFEQPRVPPGAGARLLDRAEDLPGWHITAGSVDVVASDRWQSAPDQGNQSLDLIGDRPATLEQTFATVPGQEYLFGGWVAPHPDNPYSDEGRADVSINGRFRFLIGHSFPYRTRTSMAWAPFLGRFQADASSTTLRLTDTSQGWSAGGLVLDGLFVTPADRPLESPLPHRPGIYPVRVTVPGRLDLLWLDNSRDTTAFEIHRRTGASPWVWIARVSSGTNRFADYTVHPDTTYTYRVRALNAHGASPWSAEVSATTLP
jgi:Protein of unknown function (DUF642)